MSDPAIEAAGRAEDADSDRPYFTRDDTVAAAREALKPIRELHKPFWDNCINACCSGEECRNRSRRCSNGCDEGWPCTTAELIYASEELA